MMKKKNNGIDSLIPSEDIQKPISENLKISFMDKIFKVFIEKGLTSQELEPVLTSITDEISETFGRLGIWRGEYIDRIFWLYADKDEDIIISKNKLQFFFKQTVYTPNVSKKESLTISHHIKTLKFIRLGVRPLIQHTKDSIKLAHDDANKDIKAEPQGERYDTSFDMEMKAESDKKTYHSLTKHYFNQYMETLLLDDKQNYDSQRFDNQKKDIKKNFTQNDYKDLMKFAFLGFNFFDKKNDVYKSFDEEQLHSSFISFIAPGFRRPTKITLFAFLKIIENLDFKKHIFTL